MPIQRMRVKMNNSYIYGYKRTPIGAFRGTLSKIPATELGSIVIKSLLKENNINVEKIEEVIMGNVLSANLGQAPARQAALGASLPNSVKCMTINKVCGSGLKSVMLADDSIRLGKSNLCIAGGMENMSLAPFYLEKSRFGIGFGHDKIIDSILKDGLWDPYNNFAMGNCGEHLNNEMQYTRQAQDDFAISSYEKSNLAIKNNNFEGEICPVTTSSKKGKSTFETDEEPLKFDKDKISMLKPAFSKDGTITAANASSLSDGSAAMLIGNDSLLRESQIQPKAKIVSHSSFATEPIYFTKAPIYAIQKLLKQTELSISDIDLFEINEAFSCVPMIALDKLNIPKEKLNVNGGAVSMGHPIGASGARILVTLVNALIKRKLKYGIASICIGGGEACAILIENYNK
tara:strand:- start:17132 stop:18340 length:1209 start_codon:yes stop_codon:yes gene_type:complete